MPNAGVPGAIEHVDRSKLKEHQPWVAADFVRDCVQRDTRLELAAFQFKKAEPPSGRQSRLKYTVEDVARMLRYVQVLCVCPL